jgi:hypothetical protein
MSPRRAKSRRHRALHGGDVRRTGQPRFVKLHPFPLGTEDTINDRTMKVEVGIERGAEAMDEGPVPKRASADAPGCRP